MIANVTVRDLWGNKSGLFETIRHGLSTQMVDNVYTSVLLTAILAPAAIQSYVDLKTADCGKL